MTAAAASRGEPATALPSRVTALAPGGGRHARGTAPSVAAAPLPRECGTSLREVPGSPPPAEPAPASPATLEPPDRSACEGRLPDRAGTTAPPLLRAHLAGLAVALVGAPVTLGLVLALNRLGDGALREPPAREVAFHVEPPPPRPRPTPRAPAAERTRTPLAGPRPALPAAPALGTELPGVDVGLPGFDVEPLDAVSDDALGDLSGVVHTEDTVDRGPVPRVTTAVDVPAAARARNLSGRVVLSLRIGADGSVRAVRVLEATPPGVFEEAAVRAVSAWEFEPASYRDRPVEVWATLPIEFDP